MRRRLWFRARRSGSRYVLRLHGALDGSTACQALSALAQAPGHVRELVVDLAGVTSLERFGLEVLARGAPSSARGRVVRMIGVPASEPAAEAAASGAGSGTRRARETVPPPANSASTR